MKNEKSLYRSRNSLIGGVCKGIAEYFNIDPLIVQILTVILTLLTSGLLAIAYIALWIILPLAPEDPDPVDVQPAEVHSENYGQVEYANKPSSESVSSASAATQVAEAYRSTEQYTGAAHVPPLPPKEYAKAGVLQGQTPVGKAAPGNHQPADPGKNHSTNGALWVGLILLFVGVVAILGAFVQGVDWWQFWPLILIIVGIGQMVVPGKPGRRMNRFVSGLTGFGIGVVALSISLGIVSVASLGLMLSNLWPGLLIFFGLLILGNALKAPLLTFLGGLCFIAVCAIGLWWFTIPGPTNIVEITLPFSAPFFIDVNPWV